MTTMFAPLNEYNRLGKEVGTAAKHQDVGRQRETRRYYASLLALETTDGQAAAQKAYDLGYKEAMPARKFEMLQ